jgi:hypothetical protein
MMRHAGRLHGFRALVLLVIVGGLVAAGMGVRRQVIQEQHKTRAAGLVQQLVNAETPSVPAIITAMEDYRPWVDPVLRESFPHLPEGSREQLHAALALLRDDPKQAELLYGRLLRADPIELPVIWKLLKQHQHVMVAPLLAVLEDPQADPDQRFRAACALANSYGNPASKSLPAPRRWDQVAPFVADRLLATILKNPSHYTPLMATLLPLRLRLIGPLAQTFRDPRKPESERLLATSILAEYAGDQPAVLTDLLRDAAPEQFAILLPRVQPHPAQAVAMFEAELTRAADADPQRMARRRRARRWPWCTWDEPTPSGRCCGTAPTPACAAISSIG